jgi:hypothetical protein
MGSVPGESVLTARVPHAVVTYNHGGVVQTLWVDAYRDPISTVRWHEITALLHDTHGWLATRVLWKYHSDTHDVAVYEAHFVRPARAPHDP